MCYMKMKLMGMTSILGFTFVSDIAPNFIIYNKAILLRATVVISFVYICKFNCYDMPVSQTMEIFYKCLK